MTQTQSVANLTIYPSVSNLTFYPSVANLTIYPSVAIFTIYPSVANLTIYPSVANLTIYPSVANLTIYPSVANLTIYPRVVIKPSLETNKMCCNTLTSILFIVIILLYLTKIPPILNHGLSYFQKPFTHESLLIDRKELKLTMKEKRLAKQSYVMEKRLNVSYSRPSYAAYYPRSGQYQGAIR